MFSYPVLEGTNSTNYTNINISCCNDIQIVLIVVFLFIITFIGWLFAFYKRNRHHVHYTMLYNPI